MLNSPEEYLSSLSFAPPEQANAALTPGEKIFIEKYLGLDAFEKLPEIIPQADSPALLVKEPAPFKQILIAPQPEKPVAEPELELREEQTKSPAIPPPALKIAEKQPKISVAPQENEPVKAVEQATAQIKEIQPPKTPVAEIQEAEPVEAAIEAHSAGPATTDAEIVHPVKAAIVEPPVAESKPAEPAKRPVVEAQIAHPADVAPVKAATPIAPEQSVQTRREAIAKRAISEKTTTRAQYAAPSLKERLQEAKEVQVVSFFIAGQIFLLPVIAIQEVLRPQELIKIPKAPDYVAGVINLRGRVTPLVYLSALLSDNQKRMYSEKNFIIICGARQLQMGLIVDGISNMHFLPQAKILWNAEAKLGDAAEFLCAIADLDDKVCGMVEPETIAQKILSA